MNEVILGIFAEKLLMVGRILHSGTAVVRTVHTDPDGVIGFFRNRPVSYDEHGFGGVREHGPRDASHKVAGMHAVVFAPHDDEIRRRDFCFFHNRLGGFIGEKHLFLGVNLFFGKKFPRGL